MNEAVMTAGAVPGELIFSIGRVVHTSKPPKGPSALEQMSNLLGGGLLVDLYAKPENLSQSDLQRAWGAGFLVPEDPGADIPTGSAYVTAEYISLVVYDRKTQTYFITPLVWACSVVNGKRAQAPMKEIAKGLIP